MKEALIVKYCDRILKHLNRNSHAAFYYVTGKHRNDKARILNELPTILKITENYVTHIIDVLNSNGHISVEEYDSGTARIEGSNNRMVYSQTFQMMITDSGKIFINNGGFGKEIVKRKYRLVVEVLPILISFAALIFSIYQHYSNIEFQKDYENRIEALESKVTTQLLPIKSKINHFRRKIDC